MTPEKRKFNKRVKANKRKKHHVRSAIPFRFKQALDLEPLIPKESWFHQLRKLSWEIKRKFDKLRGKRLVP